MKSNYKSLEAEERARKHYARNVRKLSKELDEMELDWLRTRPNGVLYGLISGLWNYWGDGYIFPLLKYNIEITRQGNTFIVERGENGRNNN